MEIHIEIKDFEKHLKRTDIKHAIWASFDCRLLTHPDFFGITGDEFKVYFWVISVAAISKSAIIRLHVEHTSSMLGIAKEDILSSIEKLKGKRWSVQNPYGIRTESVQNPDEIRTSTEQNTTEQNKNTRPVAKNRSGPFSISSPEVFKESMAGFDAEWRELYSGEYVERELAKALIWLKANPAKSRKTLKGWVKFFGGWFDRGWDQTTTRGPSRAAGGESFVKF